MLLELLETGDMVSVSSELIKHGEALLNRLEEFRASPACKTIIMVQSDETAARRGRAQATTSRSPTRHDG